MNIQEQAFWNSRAYGSAIVLKKSWLRLVLAVFCFVTPLTNFTILPFVHKIVRRDFKITYEV